MQSSSNQTLVKGAMGLSLGVIAAVVLYAWSVAAWNATSTAVALNALLGFLSTTASALMYSHFRDSKLLSHAIILAGLLAFSVIQIGGAITLLFDATLVLIRTPSRTVSDIIEIALLGIALFGSIYAKEHNLERRVPIGFAWILTFVFLAIYGFLFIQFLINLPESALIVLGYAIGILSEAIFIIVLLQSPRIPIDFGETERSLLYASFGLLFLSVIPLMLSLSFLIQLWAVSLTLLGFGFLPLMLALSIPQQRSIGMTERQAMMFPIGLSLLAIIPFLVAILVQMLFPVFRLEDIPAYLLSHLGVAAISGVMAFLIFAYSRRDPMGIHYSLILVFLFWSIAEIFIVFFSDAEALLAHGESVVPYIIGSMVYVIALLRSQRWISDLPEKWTSGNRAFYLASRLAVVISILFIGIWLEQVLTASYPALQGNPLGKSVLLSINLFAMFVVAYLTFRLAMKQGSWTTIEVYSVGFLSLWVAAHILKGIYSDWQAGWWAGEFILLVGLLLGPGAVGSLYLREMIRAKESQRRATLYSDILVHDISNLHQAILVSLGLLDVQTADDNVYEMALKDAEACLKRANLLIKNVRHLGEAEERGKESLRIMDLDKSIQRAIDQIGIEYADIQMDIAFQPEFGMHFTVANGLLSDIWYNLLRNSVIYSPQEKRIRVEVNLSEEAGKATWQTRVEDHGQGIPSHMKPVLFQRFMSDAKGTGLGLSVVQALTRAYGGRVTAEDRIPGDHTKGSVFVVELPVAPASDKDS
ncbi:MAG: sensor histidine kinase [Promethearchaeota archaeon]